LKVKALTAGRAKTDKNDAEMLAELLRLNAIPDMLKEVPRRSG
jgi:transposase